MTQDVCQHYEIDGAVLIYGANVVRQNYNMRIFNISMTTEGVPLPLTPKSRYQCCNMVANYQ